ncbi:MAG TPA: hypothetical protein VGB50_10950 [Flavobacterium sp.]|jgi:hypothetical protein
MRLYHYLLYVLFSIFVVSCDAEEDRNITYLDANVNGTTHMFNTFHVTEETQTEDDYTFTDVTVTASIEQSPDRLIAFIAEKNLLGTEACWYFAYIEDGHVFEKVDDSFVFDVHESTPNRIRGLFSGQLKSTETGEVINITGGGFDIFYHRVFP